MISQTEDRIVVRQGKDCGIRCNEFTQVPKTSGGFPIDQSEYPIVTTPALTIDLRANGDVSAAAGKWRFEVHNLRATHADDACENIAVNICFHVYNRTRGVDAVNSV